MIPTKRNHFYTKEIVSNAVGVYPQFKDFPTGSSDTTVEFKGGLGTVQYVVSGNVSETPPYKQSELAGGYFQTYVTGMSMSGTTSLPQLTAYRLQSGFPMAEAGLSMATGTTSITPSGTTPVEGQIGDAIWFSSSQLDDDELFIEENFDGANTKLGAGFSEPAGGGALLSLEDAYVDATEGAEQIFAGGDAFFGGGGSNSVTHNLRKWFSDGGPGSTGDAQRVSVRPLKKARKTGLWTAMNDHRGDKEQWQIYAPYWKWNDIRPILKFAKTETIEGEPGEDEAATNQNTLFNNISVAGGKIGDPAHMSEGPTLTSTAALVSAAGNATGQALQLKNTWNVHLSTPGANYYDWLFSGDQGEYHVPTQTIQASVSHIPYPLPLDIGGLINNSVSGAMGNDDGPIGDQRLSFPEIDINMKIDSMMPSPALNMASTAIVGSNVQTYGDVASTTELTGACGELVISADTDNIWPHNKTFWRDIVVTFSNCAPKSSDTLDIYVDRVLKIAYGKKTTGPPSTSSDVLGVDKFHAAEDGKSHLGPAVIGGVVFSKYYNNRTPVYLSTAQDPYVSGTICAYALPVCAYPSGAGLNDSTPLLRVTGGTDTFSPSGALVHRPKMNPQRGSITDAMPTVRLPMNEFFKMKVVFDVMQPWSTGTSWGWYQEPDLYESYNVNADEPSGVPIRVYFDVPPTEDESEGDTVTENPIDTATLPYINMPLTAEKSEYAYYTMTEILPNGGSTADLPPDERRGGPNYWPTFMTIWVNNVGFAPAGVNPSTSTPTYWSENTTWFDKVYWLSDDKAHPINNGGDGPWTGPSPIETSLTIDTIEFKNWGPQTTNMSAGAGTFSRFMTGVNDGIMSPSCVYVQDEDGEEQTRAFSTDGVWEPLQTGHYLTFGVKDWDWNPIVEAANAGGSSIGAKVGYLLWNNFSSQKIGELQRARPDFAWQSTVYDSNDDESACNSYMGMELGGQLQYISGTNDRWVPTQGLYDKVFVTTGSTSVPLTEFLGIDNPAYVSQGYISMGYEGDGDWLSTDGMTQKGFMKLTTSSGTSSPVSYYNTDGGDGKAVPRENVLTSTKITNTPYWNIQGTEKPSGVKNMLQVANTDIFWEELDDEYIIYKAGYSPRPNSMTRNPIEQGPHIADSFDVTSCTIASGGTNKITRAVAGFANVRAGMAISGSGIFPHSRMAHVIYKDPDNKTIYISQNSFQAAVSKTYTFHNAACNALGYKMKIKMVSKDMNTNTIEFQVFDTDGTLIDDPFRYADDGQSYLFFGRGASISAANNFANYQNWYISPKRYWVNMMFGGSQWNTKRQYENVCMIEETPATGSMTTQLGSTYNEATYTYNTGSMAIKGLAAVAEKPWILGVTDEMTALIVNEDYGYGSYDDEKATGGEAGKMVPVLNTQSYFDLSKMVEAAGLAPEEEVSLVLSLSDEVSTKGVTVVGDDDTTLDTSGSTYYRPQYVWEYYDEMPTIAEFTVGSQFDVLDPEVNLYELTTQSINNLKFKWSEGGEDVWYRHLLIDTSGSIEDKYHRSSFWAPINQTGVNDTDKYFNYYLNDVADRDTTQYLVKYSGDTPQMTIDGISGYAPYFKNSGVSGDGPPCYILGNYDQPTGSYGELKYSMAYEMGGSGTSNAWIDKWSLVVHCNPQWSDAASETRDEGMTICGVVQCASGAQVDPRIHVNTGNRDTPQGSLSYDSTTKWTLNVSGGAGGFDLLHVYMKDSRVHVAYNVQYMLTGDGSNLRPYMTGANQFEALLLQSATSYKMDGTQPISITVVWNKNRGIDAGAEETTSVNTNDQFRLYVNGQLEDSQSTKRGLQTTDGDNIDGPDNGGGFGRSNYAKFFVGCVPGGSEVTWDDVEVTNVYAGVGELTSGTDPGSGVYNYRMSRNGFQGKIEEIILYPYEVYVPPLAGEYILDTSTLNDFSATGTTGAELNYNARLFCYDYTNVRGRSTGQVASSVPVQWKVTGV